MRVVIKKENGQGIYQVDWARTKKNSLLRHLRDIKLLKFSVWDRKKGYDVCYLELGDKIQIGSLIGLTFDTIAEIPGEILKGKSKEEIKKIIKKRIEEYWEGVKKIAQENIDLLG